MKNELLFIAHSATIIAATMAAFFVGHSFLQAFIAVLVVVANIFVIKQITLCGITACGGGIYIIGSSFGLLLLERFFGKQSANQAVRITIISSLIFFIFTLFQLAYIPYQCEHMSAAMAVVFGRIPRITLLSLCAHTIAQYSTLYCYRLLERRASWVPVSMRNAGAIASGQIIDSILFFAGVFYGYCSLRAVMQMIMVSSIIKLCMTVLASLLVSVCAFLSPNTPLVKRGPNDD